MQVELNLSSRRGEALAIIEKAYPGLEYEDEYDGWERYSIGDSRDSVWSNLKSELGRAPTDEEMEAEEDFTQGEAIRFCGFCEALGAETMIDGWGPWAMSCLRRDTADNSEERELYKKGWAAAVKAKAEKSGRRFRNSRWGVGA